MIIFYKHYNPECVCSFCLLKSELSKGLRNLGYRPKLKEWSIDWDKWYPVSIHFNMALAYKGKMFGEFFFESNKMPKRIVEFADTYFDYILCSSKFIKEAWLNSGMDGKRLIYNTSWIDPVNPDEGKQMPRYTGKTQYLMVGNWQHDPTWQDRKGLQQVYDLWKEINPTDKVLIIKTDQYAPADLECENVIVIRDKLSKHEMAQLYSQCEYYVSAHKGEGFGRNVLEALYYGCTVGATGYSGVMDFLTSDNATLFNYDMIDHEIYPADFYADGKLSQFAQPKDEDVKNFVIKMARQLNFDNKSLLQHRVANCFMGWHSYYLLF